MPPDARPDRLRRRRSPYQGFLLAHLSRRFEGLERMRVDVDLRRDAGGYRVDAAEYFARAPSVVGEGLAWRSSPKSRTRIRLWRRPEGGFAGQIGDEHNGWSAVLSQDGTKLTLIRRETERYLALAVGEERIFDTRQLRRSVTLDLLDPRPEPALAPPRSLRGVASLPGPARR